MIKIQNPKINLIQMKDYICTFIKKNYKTKYNFSCELQKHELEDIVSGLIDILLNGISYNRYSGAIKGKTLFNHFTFFKHERIFQRIYSELLHKYIQKQQTKILSIDSSFINNVNGCEKLGRNKYYKNKRGIKLSVIVEEKGIPISILLKNGAMNDAKMVEENLNSFVYKPIDVTHILADKMYDTKEVKTVCEEKKLKLVVPYNKRNTKDKNKIRKMSEEDKKIYKGRIIVENSFCWFKKIKRVASYNEKTINSYEAYVHFAFVKMLITKDTSILKI